MHETSEIRGMKDMNHTQVKIIESSSKDEAERRVNEFTQRVREEQHILLNIASHVTDKYTFIVTYKSLERG